jgi:hypothetical protein
VGSNPTVSAGGFSDFEKPFLLNIEELSNLYYS